MIPGPVPAAPRAPQRMLFFRLGLFSNTNRSVLDGLRSHLPSTEIVDIDLVRLIKSRRPLLIRSIAASVLTYGADLALGRRGLHESFFTTGYLFERVRELASELHRQYNADCSFQTQSLFDCSRPGVPHFVYTDHTFLTNHDYAAYGRHSWAPLRRPWLIELERQIYRNAACTFTMSRNVRQTLIDAYRVSEDAALCVNAGGNVDERQLLKIHTSLERYQTQSVLFVGIDWERKGGPQLVKAFQRAREVHPNARLTIAGCRPPVRDSHIEVVGRVPLERLIELYARASIFGLPTRLEMLGIVFLEAMAAALPVIAPALGGIPDFVLHRQTGILVQPDEQSQLTAALIELLGDPEMCRALGEGGRSHFRSQYSWDHTCGAMARRIVNHFS